MDGAVSRSIWYLVSELDMPAILTTSTGRVAQWFSWMFGLAMLVAVIMAVLHFSEQRELLRIAEKAQPWWLAVAILLQAATYLAQGQTWRMVAQAGGVTVPLSVAYRLSLAQLFVSQALPSAGISGTVVVARALERRGVSRAVVMAAVLIDGISYYGGYVLVVLVALLIAVVKGVVSPLIVTVALFLLALSVMLSSAALGLAGRAHAIPMWLRRVPLLSTVLSLVGEADPSLVRRVRIIFNSILLHVAIVLLDVATMWILIRSLGEVAPIVNVYSSFIASTLLRTISIVPGGLGVFEAASVVTLQRAGISLPVALAATLLFRGVSFWLPMAPGIYFSRALSKGR